MKKLLFILMIVIVGLPVFAQQPIFISKARITFERKTNVWGGLEGGFADRIKQTTPQFKSDFFTFDSDGKKSVYKPVPEKDVVTGRSRFIFTLPANNNIVYSDFGADTYIALKNVFEKTYLVTDSLRHAKWQIKDDFREIAGFNCRRATTIIMDSIFVVAFYTDEIMISGGPESFNGLPGMILGLVINRVHMSWYATKIELNAVDEKKLVPPTKGTPIDYEKLADQIKGLTLWGTSGDKLKWAIRI